MELAVLAGFGIPGLLVVVAVLFWERWPKAARWSLVLGVGAAVLSFAVQLPRYEVKLDPPAHPEWGGFFATGEPVEEVKATLLRNGTQAEAPTVIGRLDLDDRLLAIRDEPANRRLLVTYGRHLQGAISDTTLRQAGWSRSSGVAIRALALTGRIEHIGDSTTVLGESVFRDEFGTLRVSLDAWVYTDQGVDVTVSEGDEDLLEGHLTREDELEVLYDGESVFVRIMHLGFRDSTNLGNYVQFLLFKKS